MRSSIVIETERLYMRRFDIADEALFISFFTDPDFMQYGRVGALDEMSARAVFARRIASTDNPFTKFAVIEKISGKLIGYCGVDTCEIEGKKELELGYRLIASARGRGYATEAARAVLDYYQQQGITNIIAFTAHGNNPSQSVLRKLGFSMAKTGEIESFPIVIFRR